MPAQIDPKDYRLEIKSIPLDSPTFQASTLSLVGPRAWDFMEEDEPDWVCGTFSGVVASYIRTAFHEETTVWGCIPKCRQLRQPLDVIGSILRCFQPKSWEVADKSQIEATILTSCTHFTPEIFVGISSGASAQVRRRILNECYCSPDPAEAVASMNEMPMIFLLAPAIEAIEVSVFLRKDVHAELEKVLAHLFKGAVVRP